MIKNSRLILIGGTGRNVGKTEFVCNVISKFSKNNAVFGLKVSAIFPDEKLFHGDHLGSSSDRRLFEEVRRDTRKDTSRMLRAGADRVFYLQSDDEHILDGYYTFCKQIPENSLIVCESNSLGCHVKPGLHIVVQGADMSVKPRAKAQLELADMVVVSTGERGFPELGNICIDSNNTWFLQSKKSNTSRPT